MGALMRWLRPNRVRTFAPESVTRRGSEVEPRSVGLSEASVERVWRSTVRFYRTGLQPAIALCLRRRGQIVLDRTIGHARGNGPGEEGPFEVATPDTLFNFFSGSKAVTAMLVHLLDEQGVLHLDDPVAHYIPKFRKNGKGAITIRHILTHRAGIPVLSADLADLDLLEDPEGILDVLCNAEPISPAGRQLAYHAVTGGFVLDAIMRRTTGQNVRALVDERVRRPLGLQHLSYGVRPDQLHRVARESFTGPVPRPPFSGLLQRSLGLDIRQMVALANDPRFRTAVVPSGNVIGTANEIGRFFELLLRGGELDGVRVFEERTVRRALAEQSYAEFDRMIMLPVRYSMGFMLGSNYLSFYGPRTPRAFGHLGFTNVLAWADPERDISVALMNNGKPFVAPELVLWLDIMRVIARCVPREMDRGPG